MTISPAYPNLLTNGTPADATQVMADFYQIQNDVNANAAHNGANTDITSLTGITTPLGTLYGGTGVAAASAAALLTALGAAPLASPIFTGTIGGAALTLTGNASIGGTLAVTGNATLSGANTAASLTVTTNLSVGANANVVGTLAVTGATTLGTTTLGSATGVTPAAGDNTTKLATTAFTAHKTAAAWVEFAGASGAIAASNNVSSVTRNSTGDYTINFTTGLGSGNYALVGSCIQSGGGGPVIVNPVTQLAGSANITTKAANNSSQDPGIVSVIVFA